MALEITSTAFTHGDIIPNKFTCDGQDISPDLLWQGAPAGTQSFALIMDDPDAPMGTWDHWIVFNLPANINALPEEIMALPPGTRVGQNSWERNDYGGPCPPDREHRYFFKLHALDTMLDLPVGVKKVELETAMQGHILAKAELIGNYNRPRNTN